MISGIRSLHFAHMSDLQIDAIVPIGERMCVKCNAITTEIKMLGNGEVNESSEMGNDQEVFTTTLTFHTHEAIELPAGRAAFFLTDMCGNTYLLGTDQRPVPVVVRNFTNPATPTSRRGYMYTVSYTNTHGLLEIL